MCALKSNRVLSLAGALLLASLVGCAQQPAQPNRAAENEPGSGTVVANPVTASTPVKSSPAKTLPTAKEPVVVADICREPYDIWVRIRNGFVLPDKEKRGVVPDQLWFARNQEYLDRVGERASPYIHYIVESLEARGMPSELALLPIVESAYQPFAYSNGRAAGLWQFIPGTGKRFGLRQNWWYDGRRDVAMATKAALDYLQDLHDMFGGDWLLALAAYNSGEGNVRRAIARNKAKGRPTDFWSLDLPRETRGYVPKLLAISNIVANPPANGIILPTIADEPFLTQVEVGSQIDLALAAQLAEMPVEDLYRYNPAYNRWATDPEGPHQLLIPIEKVATFEERLKEYPTSQRIRWERHTVARGENLGTIAKQYKTTTDVLKGINKLAKGVVRVGQGLIIPVAHASEAEYTLSAEQRLEKARETPRGGEKIDYVVQSGDTLWGIARRHEVSPTSLAQWNGMATRDPLKAGATLVVWQQQEPDKPDSNIKPVNLSTNSAVNFVHPLQENLRQRVNYVVRRGDTLDRIAQRFRVSSEHIKQWNNLNPKRRLRPGKKLTLYVDVTAQSGRI